MVFIQEQPHICKFRLSKKVSDATARISKKGKIIDFYETFDEFNDEIVGRTLAQ